MPSSGPPCCGTWTSVARCPDWWPGPRAVFCWTWQRADRLEVPNDPKFFDSRRFRSIGCFGYAFEQAVRVAQRVPSAAVDLLHVMEGGTSEERIRQLAGQLQTCVSEKAASMGGLDGMRVGVHVRQGDPVREIVQAAVELDAALIVLGCPTHPHLKSLILGTIAGKLLPHAPCPVILAGPKPGEPQSNPRARIVSRFAWNQEGASGGARGILRTVERPGRTSTRIRVSCPLQNTTRRLFLRALSSSKIEHLRRRNHRPTSTPRSRRRGGVPFEDNDDCRPEGVLFGGACVPQTPAWWGLLWPLRTTTFDSGGVLSGPRGSARPRWWPDRVQGESPPPASSGRASRPPSR
jgi:nucleotide-binding universal stress UspA family protein